MSDINPDETESIPDLDSALESAGFVESEDSEETDESRSDGVLDKLGSLTGSGKSLDSYNDDPIAGIWARDDGSVPRGAKHIARGVDGLSPFAAAHPFVDIAVGFVLLKADSDTDGGLFGSGDDDNPGSDDLESLGDMTS